MSPSHSCVIAPHFKGTLSHVSDGKYGRMFPNLAPLKIDVDVLRTLGRAGSAWTSGRPRSTTARPTMADLLVFAGAV